MTDNAPAPDAISTPDELAATAVSAEDTPESPAKSFATFGLGADLLRGITEAGFSEPTLIQQQSIPYLLAGRDLIGQALTGSGKTAAYALPAMELIRGKPGLQFLVLVPTRELAAQVSSEIFKLGQFAGIRTAAFTGDAMLAVPMIVTPGFEVARIKESRAPRSAFPLWGPEEKRGALLEIATAMSLLNAGADLLVLYHPLAAQTLKRKIEEMTTWR